MFNRRRLFVLVAFIVGWVTYQFTLFDVGRFSITLLLLTSFALTVSSFRSKYLFAFPSICLLSSTFLAFCIAFLSYAEYEKTFTHLIQTLLTVGVMVGSQSLDWKRLFPRFRKHLLWIAAIVLAYGCYQFVARQQALPFAFLPVTNQQLGLKDVDRGLQRGARYAMTDRVGEARVSSFFIEPGNLAMFMLWVFAVGYGCTKGRTGSLLMCIGIAGVLLSQSMGGFIGLLFLPIVMIILRFDFRKAALSFLFAIVAVVAILTFFSPVFDMLEYRSRRMITERKDYLIQRRRWADVEDNFRIFMEAPFSGHGMASIKKVAPDNTVANLYQAYLIERGLLGSFLVLAPFFWACAKLALLRSCRDEVSNAALMVLIVVIYSFGWKPHMFYTPLYLTLGFALSQIPRQKRTLNQRAKARQRRNTEGCRATASSKESLAV